MPAYLLVVPLRLPPDAPMEAEVARAMPLLEAVEHAALRAGVPVDARIEKGRTPTTRCSRSGRRNRSTASSRRLPTARADGLHTEGHDLDPDPRTGRDAGAAPAPAPEAEPSRAAVHSTGNADAPVLGALSRSTTLSSAAAQARFPARRLEQFNRVS